MGWREGVKLHQMGVLFFLFLAIASGTEAQILGGCQTKKQYSIDMGSTTTKIAIANVQICLNSRRVIGPIERRDFAFDFNSRAKSRPTLNADDQAVLEQMLRDATKGLDPSQFYGCVATGGSRKFVNGAEFLAKLSTPCRVIDPSAEGRLGYHSLLGNDYPGCGVREKVMWDIGGASSQIYSESNNVEKAGNFKLGSDRIRELLATNADPSKKCVSSDQGFDVSKTPNPIGSVAEAITRVKREVIVAPDTAARLKNGCIVGIGKAHALAIQDQMKYIWPQMKAENTPACFAIRADTYSPKSYTVNQLRCMSDFLAKYNDCELKGLYTMIPGALNAPGPDPKFSLTNVSTLIFALAVLDGNVPPDRAIHVENVSLAEPLLTYKLEWLPSFTPRAVPTNTTNNPSGGRQ